MINLYSLILIPQHDLNPTHEHRLPPLRGNPFFWIPREHLYLSTRHNYLAGNCWDFQLIPVEWWACKTIDRIQVPSLIFLNNFWRTNEGLKGLYQRRGSILIVYLNLACLDAWIADSFFFFFFSISSRTTCQKNM
jgi:hypothetical protein